MSASPPDWAVQFLADARIGHLATASADSQPHVVPICYAVHEDRVYSVIDEKPKSGRRLLRLRNIDATGQAALVVDRYDEDWTRLAFVLVRGPASIITAEDPMYRSALTALRDKYPQYLTMSLEDSEVVVLTPDRWTTWQGSN